MKNIRSEAGKIIKKNMSKERASPKIEPPLYSSVIPD